MSTIPKYRDLPEFEAIGERHAWGVFGKDDQLGRVNLMTDAAVVAAAGEIRLGRRFNLSLSLTDPEPSWSHNRKAFKHTIFSANRNSQDDYVDSFYMQKSTQWDGLRHVRAREFGFYGGRQEADAGAGGKLLGIEQWVNHGLVGRGVLADVAGYMQSIGQPLDARRATPITVDMLARTLDKQGVTLRSGDVLMLRTGYVDAYLAASPDERVALSEKHDCPGLHPGPEMTEFLWDSGIAAIAADNPAVEVVPGPPEAGSAHRRLIPLLGFALGEFFVLGELAKHCAGDGRYTCFFTAVPLNIPGGVGSPGNAIAIK